MQTEFIDFMNQFKRGSPFSETDAIMDILTMADENGELYSTIRQLMDRWKWSNTKTVSFIRQLEEKDVLKDTKKTEKRQKKDRLFLVNTELLGVLKDRKKTEKRQKKDTNKVGLNENEEVCKRIIDYLNKALDTNYKTDTDNSIKKCIQIKLKQNYSEQDFYTVIDKKAKEWKNTAQERYLRPSILFGDKFSEYLNQKIIAPKQKNSFNNFEQNNYDFGELEKILAENIKAGGKHHAND